MKPTFAVLVVDTDAAALAGLVDLLRGAGYKATGAPTFEIARELLETAVFDLLMTDLRLMTHRPAPCRAEPDPPTCTHGDCAQQCSEFRG